MNAIADAKKVIYFTLIVFYKFIEDIDQKKENTKNKFFSLVFFN